MNERVIINLRLKCKIMPIGFSVNELFYIKPKY